MMSNYDDRDLINILSRLVNGNGDDQDIEQLHNWSKTSTGQNVIQIVIQNGKYNTNIGEGKNIKIGDFENTELIEEIRDLLRSQSVTPDLDIDWQEISQVMVEEYQGLTTNPLTAGEGVFHSSDRVYVPLGLVERKQKARRKEDVSPEKGSELYRETEITQRFENKEFLEQVLKLGQSPKSRGKRIAIIGEPGAGKTTLLQQIAQWITKQVDDAIVIWLSLADLRGQELEIYLLEKWLQAVARRLGQAEVTPQVKNAFVAQFQQRRVWLLLDGVDEMQLASIDPLSKISQQVKIGGLLSQAKMVLTCRVNLWDGNVNALNTFDTYRTLDFSYPQQVEQFIGNWFSSISPAKKQTGQNLCIALKKQGKERIRDLVKNPLRLTLLCFNWYLGDGKLPETKAGLYEQFVDDFYEWKREEFTTTGKQRRQLNESLGELAREAIDKEETRLRLRQEFVCKYLGEPDDEDSLFSLALRLGWLNKVGVDAENRRKEVYAFLHPTFQEYFAASVIDNWHYFLNHIHENPSHPDANYRIFEQQWKEAFLLWLGRANIQKNNKEQLIHELVEFNDDCGNFYRIQAYFLAAEGISEFAVSQNYVDVILDKLLKLGFGTLDDESKKIKRFPGGISKSGRDVLVKSYHPSTTSKLLKLLQTTKNEEDQEKIAKIILLLSPGDRTALLCLINLFNTSQNHNLIQLILKDFEELDLGELQVEVAKTLKDFLDASLEIYFIGYPEGEKGSAYLRSQGVDIFLCLDVIRTLRLLRSEFYETSKTLLEKFLEFNKLDDRSRCLIADQLLEIDTEHPSANTILRTIYQSSSDDEAKFWAALSLYENDLDKISHLNQLLDSSKDIEAATNIAEALLKINSSNTKALDFLTELLDTTYGFYCFYSAEILLKFNPETQQAINALFNLLESDEVSTRRQAAQALGNIYVDCQDAVDVLLKDLSHQSEERLIFPFPEICLGNLRLQFLLADVVVKLKECLQQPEGRANRSACYDSLWNYASQTSYPVFYDAWHNKC